MKIISLLIAALAFTAMAQKASSSESVAEDSYVTIAYGSAMMQVPLSLAVQLCPGTDAGALAEEYAKGKEFVCEIPYETYASHDSNTEQEAE
jgi:hypothetical protein